MTLHSNLTQYSEIAAGDQQFQLQNAKLLRVSLNHGPVEAAAGSMVAYQGDVTFENKGSGGLGKMLKKAATGEGTRLMHIEGQGEVFLADEAHQIQVMYLGERLGQRQRKERVGVLVLDLSGTSIGCRAVWRE